MRLNEPSLQDELRVSRLRSLRLLIAPGILAVALYAFYAIGAYNTRDNALKTPRHGNIYGTVVDEKQRPVNGVSVTIAFSSSKEPMPYLSPTTDAQGHFYLPDLPAGTYILQASADGFDMQTQNMFLDSGKTLQVKLPIYRRSARMPKTQR